MTTVRRRAALSVAAAALALPAFGSAGWAQVPPPATPPGDVPAGAPQPAGDPVVHSWALAPAGTGEPDGAGNRPNLSYEVAPGAEVTDQLTLYNLSNVQLTFRLYATDAFNNEDGAFDVLPFDRKPRDVGTWVTLPQANITLQPRTQATFPMTLKVPAGATPGDHVGAVLASSEALGTGPDNKVVTLDRRTGPRLYLRVDGPLAPELTAERIKTTYKPSLNPLSGTATVRYRIVNRGNVRLGGKQQVSIGGVLGVARKRKPATDLPELLPGQGIDIETDFEGVAATGLAVTRVEIDPVQIAAVGEELKQRSRQAFTLAVPFTVLALLLAALLLRRARRSYLRHAAESAGVSGAP